MSLPHSLISLASLMLSLGLPGANQTFPMVGSDDHPGPGIQRQAGSGRTQSSPLGRAGTGEGRRRVTGRGGQRGLCWDLPLPASLSPFTHYQGNEGT